MPTVELAEIPLATLAWLCWLRLRDDKLRLRLSYSANIDVRLLQQARLHLQTDFSSGARCLALEKIRILFGDCEEIASL